jgi:hypothetical protein
MTNSCSLESRLAAARHPLALCAVPGPKPSARPARLRGVVRRGAPMADASGQVCHAIHGGTATRAGDGHDESRRQRRTDAHSARSISCNAVGRRRYDQPSRSMAGPGHELPFANVRFPVG